MIKKLSLRLRLMIIAMTIIIAIAVILAVLSTYNVGYVFSSAWDASDIPQIVPDETPQSGAAFYANEENMQVHIVEQPSNAASEKTGYYAIAVERFSIMNWVYTALVILAGGVAAWFVLGRALTPVKRLSREIAGISENQLDVRIQEFQAGDEINSLADSFNLMLSRLEGAFENQKSFSTAAAHELKTPLATIKARLDVTALDEHPTKEAYAKTLSVVRNQTQRMIGIVDDLFVFSSTNGYERHDEVELEGFIREITEHLEDVISEKNLNVSITGGPHSILANRSMLERALTNIVENAAKYNKTNGKIDISIKKEDAGCLVVVKDTGAGIPEEQAGRIFDPFYRVDKSRSRRTAGAGLGLAIAKKMIEAHGGSITVSPNEGGGSVFSVLISSI